MIPVFIRVLIAGIILLATFSWFKYLFVILVILGIAWFVIRLGADIYYWWVDK